MIQKFSSEELARLAAAGFVANEQGELELAVVATKVEAADGAAMKFAPVGERARTGVVIALPGNVESLLQLLGKGD